MTNSAASFKTIKDYLASLPAERKAAVAAVHEVIMANLPKGYEAMMLYGMIGYVVPHSLYPAGYHCDPTKPLMYASLGSQKSHMCLYLMSAYGDPETKEWFINAYAASGKKPDMGQACLRFKKLEDLPLDVIGQLVARTPAKKYIESVIAILSAAKNRRLAKTKTATKPTPKAKAKAKAKTKTKK